MSFYKFKENDIFYNRIKAHPKVNFIIYSGSIYYNNKNFESGAFADPVLHMPSGYVSLYELNVDRPAGQLIYPFITKDGSLTSFRTISTDSFNSDFVYGDVVTGSYPMSASVSRDYIPENSSNRKLSALRNTINYYRILSEHFQFSSSFRGLEEAPVNLVSIPSIFYGSSIKKGSVDLRFYISGTLIAQAQDEKRNGEIIQIGPPGSQGSGSVVGITLYNEGFLILTSSGHITSHSDIYAPLGSATSASWLNFATTGSGVVLAASSSFDITFEGTNYIPNVTMFAHAREGMLNYSSNPTFLQFSSVSGSENSSDVSSSLFQHQPNAIIKNTVKSRYNDPTASFQKQTFISRIGIYDEDKNLIAIAKVATPVKKREIDSYTFKLKLDI